MWFTASRVGPDSSLHAVTLTGEHRNVFPAMGRLIIHDISPQGRVLLERRNTCQEIRFRRSGERAERDLSGGLPQPITPPGVATWANTVSPDGRHVAAPCGPRMCLYPVDGGEAQPVPGLGGSDAVLGWGLPRKLLVRSPPLLPARIQHLDLETGLATPWLDLAPTDRSGVVGMNAFAATPDGAAYAYSYSRALSDLYVAERLE